MPEKSTQLRAAAAAAAACCCCCMLLLFYEGSRLPFQAEELPRSTVTAEAVKRFQASIRARMAGSDALPDKTEDEWTSSDALRKDLRGLVAGFSENLTILEVGSYFGYTTRILSDST